MKSKTGAVLSIALAIGAALSVTANAESFNMRGQLFTAVAPQGSDKPFMGVTPSLSGYNDRDLNFIEAAPVGSPGTIGPMVVQVPSGFNDRGYQAFDTSSSGSQLQGDRYVAKVDSF